MLYTPLHIVTHFVLIKYIIMKFWEKKQSFMFTHYVTISGYSFLWAGKSIYLQSFSFSLKKFFEFF